MDTLRFIIYELGIALISASLSAGLIFIALKSKGLLKHIVLFIAYFLISISLFEVYWEICKDKTKSTFSGTFADNETLSGYKPNVGFGPKADTTFQVTAIRKNNDSLIYNVTYSIKEGRRLVPNNNDTATSSVWFLGCSHIFGDGLNDEQTLPAHFVESTNYKYDVRNYAFSGYGTHQALQTIGNELAPNSKPSLLVIYSIFDDHFLRTAGKMLWNVHDPMYVVENDTLIFKGTFDENRTFKSTYITKRLKSIWYKSALHQSILRPRINSDDVVLVNEIIAQINRSLEANNSRFIVLVRKSHIKPKLQNQFFEALEENKIEYYHMDSIIDDLQYGSYRIIGDGHPNEIFNKKIATFLSSKIK